jgi:hypothetical protein
MGLPLEPLLEHMDLPLAPLARLALPLEQLWRMEPGRQPDKWPSTREDGARTLLLLQVLWST